MVHIQAVFTGSVQGVGFRYTACWHAREHGITGTVQNLSNGSVELYAAGDKKQVDAFLMSLKNSFSRYIDSVEVHYLDSEKNYSGFQVIY